MLIFTDSCKQNPGPCGAGAAIVFFFFFFFFRFFFFFEVNYA